MKPCRHLIGLWLLSQMLACAQLPITTSNPQSKNQSIQHGQQANSNLYKRQDEQLAKLEQERLIAKGEWLLKDLGINQPPENESSKNWLLAHPDTNENRQATELSLQLEKIGQQALVQNNLELAAQVLPLAWQLSPSDNNKALQEKLRLAIKPSKQPLEATLSDSSQLPSNMADLSPPTPQPINGASGATYDKTSANIPAVQNRDLKLGKRLTDSFKRALVKGNFTEARQLLEKLQKQGIDNVTFANLNKRLNDRIAEQVKSLMEAGINDYSQQNYEEALKSWKQAQLLAPNNIQLTAHIERASKVLEKLQDLRNKHPKSLEKMEKSAQ